MKMKKCLVGAFTALALAVSAGCQMFHSPEVEQVVRKEVDPLNVLYQFELNYYAIQLKDPVASDIDWQKFKRDAVKLDHRSDLTPRGEFIDNGELKSRDVHLNSSITPEMLESLLALQGEVSVKKRGASVLYVVNGEQSQVQLTESRTFLPAKQCEPDGVRQGLATFGHTFSVNPRLLGNGGMMLSYMIDFDPKIEVPDCSDPEGRTTLPGGMGGMRSTVAYMPPGTTLVVSGLREQQQDPVTFGYADAPGNEVIVVVIRPKIVN